MLLIFRWGAEQSCIARVETGRSAEVVLGVCELILPPEPLKASFIIRGGRTNRSRCVARDDMNASHRHVVQRGRHIPSL